MKTNFAEKYIELQCDYCSKPISKEQWEINKHISNGYKHWFCDRKCSTNFQTNSKRKNTTDSLLSYNKKRKDAHLYHIDRYRNDPEYRARKLKQSAENRNAVKYHERWLSKKLKALEMFGNKCSFCGYDKCTAALDFHHLNQAHKERIQFQSSWRKIAAQLKECILICSNCHRELHFTGDK